MEGNLFDSFEAALKGEPRPKKITEAQVNLEDPKVRSVIEAIQGGARVPLKYLRESIGVGAWDSLMLDAMHKRLTKGWGAVQASLSWAKIPSFIKPVRDFRNQYAIQAGEFTTLPKVPEHGAYHQVEFTDDRAVYTVAKYGALFSVSYESMTNDDLGALNAKAEKFGRAAPRTVESFVFKTMLDGNPKIYDDKALFHSDHKNDLGASKALNHDNFEEAALKLMNQTDIDGNPLDLTPKMLVVHKDQAYDAARLMKSLARPGTGNNDINVHLNEVEIVSTSLVTTGRWYLIGDPSIVETLEIGFLGGRQEPELFMEAASSGHAFDYDEERIKIRLVFGGAWTDYRGVVRANV
jgi:hypothetical protein